MRSKDLSVEIPVYISHPSSWNDLPPPTEGSIMQDAIEIEQQNLADLENRELSGALQLISGKRWSEPKQLCSVCSNKKPNKTQDLSIWTAVPRRRASSSPSVSKSEPPVFNLPIQLATVTNEVELQGSGTVKHEVKILGAATNLRIANPDPPSQIMASVMEEDEEIKLEDQGIIEEEGEIEDSQVTTTYGKRDRLKMRISRIGNILRVGGNKKDVKKNSASTSAAAAAGTDTNKSIASSSFSFSKSKTVGSNISTVSAITQLDATILTSSETSDISESENPPTGYEDESASEHLVTASEADQDELEGTMEYSTFIGPVTHELWEQAEDDFIIS